MYFTSYGFPSFSGDRKPYRNRNCKSFRVLCGIYQCDFIAGSVLPEQDKDIRDLLSSKYMPIAKLYSIRIIQVLIYLMLLLGVYMYLLKAGNCTFAFGRVYMGELATMVFLGGMGIFFYALTDQVVVGYMIPLLYYMLNIAISPNKIKVFYLFSMSMGKYEWKWTLGIAGVVLLVAGIAIRSKRK